MSNSQNISVSYSDSICKRDATQFAEQHQLNCVSPELASSLLTLNFTPDFIELVDNENNNRIHVDFLSGSTAHRKQFGGGKGQAIAKAIGLKTTKTLPTVLDATAGLAKDAFVIATLGCPVIMLEQSAIIAKLVSDGIERACYDDDFTKTQNNGFSLIQQNCLNYFKSLTMLPDVIYLDPMYPDKKKSALVKKNMQLLQKLLGADEDTTQLLEESLRYAKNRVVVKRPKGAEAISGRTPDTTIESKKTRYDVYFTFNN
ncbi:MAG: class I SAM-dependent methyltransferase [Thiohalomonadales bacterium]